MLIGDNGFFLGERGFAGKWYGYEESIRVPLIFYDPNARRRNRNQQRQEMVLNIDVAPTLLDLAGLPIPESMQGKSLRPLLSGKTPTWRNEFFYEHLFQVPLEHQSRVGNIPRSIGVRTSRFKYLRYLDFENYEQLFDLEMDPDEKNNLAVESAFADRLKELREKTDRYVVKLK